MCFASDRSGRTLKLQADDSRWGVALGERSKLPHFLWCPRFAPAPLILGISFARSLLTNRRSESLPSWLGHFLTPKTRKNATPVCSSIYADVRSSHVDI